MTVKITITDDYGLSICDGAYYEDEITSWGITIHDQDLRDDMVNYSALKDGA